MPRAFAEIGFTPNVKTMQEQYGSADAYAGFLADDVERRDRLGPDETAFIAGIDGFFQATVSETGWPYVQFRGGPAGFVKVLDGGTIAYADFRGNRQYLSVGNLTGNDRVALILVDYPNRRRLKIWGRATFVRAEDDPGLIEQLHDFSYRAKPERAVIINIAAFDWNCPQHIPQRFTVEEIERQFAPLQEKIAALSAENKRLKTALDQAVGPDSSPGAA